MIMITMKTISKVGASLRSAEKFGRMNIAVLCKGPPVTRQNACTICIQIMQPSFTCIKGSRKIRVLIVSIQMPKT